MKRIALTLFALSILGQLALADSRPNANPQKAQPVSRYRVPDPDPENNMIIEFAMAIEGTDGTPQGIGQKANRNPGAANKNNGRQPRWQRVLKKPAPTPENLPVMGF